MQAQDACRIMIVETETKSVCMYDGYRNDFPKKTSCTCEQKEMKRCSQGVHAFEVGMWRLIAVGKSSCHNEVNIREGNMPRNQFNAIDVEEASKYRIALLSTMRSTVQEM